MREYKIAFVGMGSIGKRHLKNVCSYLHCQGHTYKIDLYRSSINHILDNIIMEKVNEEFFLSSGVPSEKTYDIVFISNPTSLHYETIKTFFPITKSMFIEKPVFDNTEVDIASLGNLSETICYVACPLRYNAVIDYIKKNISYKKAYSVRAISSSYLPEWRPGIDYRTCYSAHRNMGGGVGVDLIHEWDYLTWLFGEPIRGFSIQNKLSNLEIDSDDVAIYIAHTDKTAIEIHLDYFGRMNIRKLQIFMPTDTIECDLINGTIDFLCFGKRVEVERDRNSYQMKEIIHFFDIIDGRCDNDSTIQNALKVLKYARGEF